MNSPVKKTTFVDIVQSAALARMSDRQFRILVHREPKMLPVHNFGSPLSPKFFLKRSDLEEWIRQRKAGA